MMIFLVILAFSLPVVMPATAETLPGGVSDIIRDLGEMRDVSWGLLDAARKAYPTNEAALTQLNVRYIEASAVANSLIEQFQLETAAHTTLQVKRYEKAVAKTKEKCEALTNEWHRLMSPVIKTRGGSSDSTASPVMANAAKAVSIADGLLDIVTKNKKVFRNLDEQQRVEVRKLLEERRWRPLDTSSHENQSRPKDSTGNSGKPSGTKPTSTNSPASQP